MRKMVVSRSPRRAANRQVIGRVLLAASPPAGSRLNLGYPHPIRVFTKCNPEQAADCRREAGGCRLIPFGDGLRLRYIEPYGLMPQVSGLLP